MTAIALVTLTLGAASPGRTGGAQPPSTPVRLDQLPDRDTARAARFDRLFGRPAGPPVVVASRSDQSTMIGNLEGRIPPRMPPFGSPLGPDQLSLIRGWIDAGAGRAEFDRVVLPIFKARCTLCHGMASAGGLRLDSYDAFRRRIGGLPPAGRSTSLRLTR
jgi:hypothetical protein